MKIAYAIRTCSSVYNYWNSSRMIDADKPTILLTCVNSLLKSIAGSGHDYVLSFHDDTSDPQVIDTLKKLCDNHGLAYQFYFNDRGGNFISQYEWCTKQDADYIYCVEDDYLHKPQAIKDMVAVIDYLKTLQPIEYAVHPFNCPHRYSSFESLYPSYIIAGPNQYWRSCFHSTHTFFVSVQTFRVYDSIMRDQAYNWFNTASVEDKTINQIWRDQQTMLFTPLSSLAFHIADRSHQDPYEPWYNLWQENLCNIH